MAKVQKINWDFLAVMSSCLEQYIRGRLNPIQILKILESKLSQEDKSNWNPRNSFKGFELIETFLEVKGITQAELSRLINLSPTKVNDLIKGRRKISPKIAKQLAQAFEVDHTIFL
jgi:DNA-binding transcriptional regulator YdaS (Cro superfamily)